MTTQTKQETYSLLYKQIAGLLSGESDTIATMANVAAMVHDAFGFWWTGFYRVSGNELLLGPFQGPVACMHIGYGKGVCGTAWKERRTIVVPDVEQFPGHIACSSESRSEIVVPVVQKGAVVAVLDIDSRELNTFDDADAEWLEKIVALLPPLGSEREIWLAAGCFWGAEKYLKLIEGVTFTEVGFANGNTENPTYKEVYTDQTGYAETVHLRYNPDVVSLRFLLEMYFKAIDPTSLNKQGEDEGTRYRTGIYYTDAADRVVIDKVMSVEAKKYGLPLCVEVEPLRNFYRAEEYHQDYLDKNPSGYCHLPVALFELARKTKEKT
ncbi:MAG: peptide-methionine (S)-S-oxide reductase MsrA [Bacteroidales bacterium]|nr:peptide-methionine (S)-S-oxide reductase MsrA [Bacteroidales bacterium]